MTAEAGIAGAARLLGDATRAAMCTLLLDGRFHTAGELARAAGVSSSTASEHLGRLLDGRLVTATRQGRHRYYRLAGPEVAAALEALCVLAARDGGSAPVHSLRAGTARAQLRAGRTCYDHLAGELGVDVTRRLVRVGVLTPELGVRDLAPLAALALDLPPGASGPLSRPCLDWTERHHHLAGPLARRLTERLFELDWLRRLSTPRAVRLTDAGREGLAAVLGDPAEAVPA
jgi:DNA-binding transcriptional ArsR family regulator